jgi:hypothetical protein
MQEFNFIIEKSLQVGLRPSSNNRRGVPALVESEGLYPFDGALAALEKPTVIDISGLDPAPSFPFPQVFELNNLTLLCTETAIYEVSSGGSLTLALGSLTEGNCWTVADFGRFLALANGKQTVYRDGASLEWSVDDPYGLGSATSVCNFRGQAIVTAPGVEVS